MMPVPSHLKNIVISRDAKIDEEPLVADICCPCGGKEFELLYPGEVHEHAGEVIPCTSEIDGKFFFVLKYRCDSCSQDHLLLDADFHGWNGLVCHDDEQAKLDRPHLIEWKCQECDGTKHTGVVRIQTEGREDFIEVVEDEFDHDLWPDAFGWFSLDVVCSNCKKETEELVSYETM